MSIKRWATKRDTAESGIVKVLRDCGMSVQLLDTPVDLLVGFRRRTFLVEVKSGTKGYAKKLNENQEDFVAKWRGSDVVILRSEQDAMDWAVQVAVETERAA